MRQKQNLLIATTICASLLGSFASLAAPKSLGRERAWEAVQDSERDICYMISFPIRSEGNYTRRDPVYITVSIRPSDNVVGEISYNTGYTYNTQPATFSVGNDNFSLTTKESWAWTNNSEEDAKLLSAMIKGNSLIVKGQSQRGTLTTDTFSLSGVTASWNKVKAACGQ
ncbi:MAG: hypothetical protein ACK5MJ_08625 [Alphaproteobacteria bacterium]